MKLNYVNTIPNIIKVPWHYLPLYILYIFVILLEAKTSSCHISHMYIYVYLFILQKGGQFFNSKFIVFCQPTNNYITIYTTMVYIPLLLYSLYPNWEI